MACEARFLSVRPGWWFLYHLPDGVLQAAGS